MNEVKMPIKIKPYSCIFPECQDIPNYNIYDINTGKSKWFCQNMGT